MKVLLTETFTNKLLDQVDFISQDSPSRAKKFKKDLIDSLRNISKWPYKSRKSIYFDDSNIRDHIFKGYVIIYRIKTNKIEVFGLVKYEEKP